MKTNQHTVVKAGGMWDGLPDKKQIENGYEALYALEMLTSIFGAFAEKYATDRVLCPLFMGVEKITERLACIVGPMRERFEELVEQAEGGCHENTE